MLIRKEIPEYNNRGFQYIWEENFCICTDVSSNVITINANSAGLTSLAWHLLTLAQNEYPLGSHTHYDEYNSLETGSVELIINKV